VAWLSTSSRFRWLADLAWLAAMWGGAVWLHGPGSALLAAAAALWTLATPILWLRHAWLGVRREREAVEEAAGGPGTGTRPAARASAVPIPSGPASGAEIRVRRALVVAAVFCPLWACLLAAVAMRGEFHQTDPTRRENLEPDPYLGHRVALLPEQAAMGKTLAGTVGQRLERPDPSRKQVVLLGDSVLYGWGVADEDSPGPVLARLVRTVQVVNASVSGYSLDQYLLYLQQILPLLDPSVIVLGVYAGNDYESSGVSQWHGHSKPLFLPDGDEGLRLWRAQTPWYDCVDVLSGSLLWTYLWRWPAAGEWALEAFCRPLELPVDVHEEVVRRTLAGISALASQMGAEVLFVLLPDRNDFCRDNPYATKAGKHDRLEALLKEGGREVFLFRDTLRISCEEATGLYLPEDAAHFTARGIALLADALAAELERRFGVK